MFMPTSRREFLRDALTFTAALVVGGGAALVTTEGGAELSRDLGFGNRESMTDKAALSSDEKARIISEYFKTAEGREKLGAAMAEPIRARLTYRSVPVELPPVDMLRVNQVREGLGYPAL